MKKLLLKNKKLFLIDLISATAIIIVAFFAMQVLMTVKVINEADDKFDRIENIVDIQWKSLEAQQEGARLVANDHVKTLAYMGATKPYLSGEIENLQNTDAFLGITYFVLDKDRKLISYDSTDADDYTDSSFDEFDNIAECSFEPKHLAIINENKDATINYIYYYNQNKYYVAKFVTQISNEKETATWENVLNVNAVIQNASISVINPDDNNIIFSSGGLIKGHCDIEQTSEGLYIILDSNGKSHYGCGRMYRDVLLLVIANSKEITSDNIADLKIIFIIILTALIIFSIYIAALAEEKSSPDEAVVKILKRNFAKTKIVRASSLSILLIIVVFFVCLFISIMYDRVGVSNFIADNSSDSKAVVDEYDEYENYYYDGVGKLQIDKAYTAQEILSNHPELWNRDEILKIEEALGVLNLSVFDMNGRVIATGSGRDNFQLPSDPEGVAYQLWDVISGTDVVILDPIKRENKPTVQYIGVRRLDADGLTDGIVEIGISPEQYLTSFYSFDINKYLNNLTLDSDGEIICVKKDGGIVVHHDEEKYLGKSIEELGLDETKMDDGYAGFESINNKTRFVNVVESETDYIIIFNSYDVISPYLMLFLIFVSLCLWPVCSILWWHQLKNSGQTDREIIEDGEGITVFDQELIMMEEYVPVGKEKKTGEGITAKAALNSTLGVVYFAFSAYVCFNYLFCSYLAKESSIIWYLVNRKWEHSFNFFALAQALMSISMIYVVYVVSQTILKLISRLTGARGETVSRLLTSLLKYSSVIFCIYYVAIIFGFDAKTVVASLGILSMAIGFGAQDMIKDILAGIFAIFEKNYKVGDMLMVDNEWYWVKSIGIRTTILQSFGKIKIVNNSAMTGVINLSAAKTTVNCTFTFGNQYKLAQIEEMIEKELLVMTDSFSEYVTRPPKYIGVVELLPQGTTVGIRLYCKVIYKGRVKRMLNRQIRLMLDKNNISIPVESFHIDTNDMMM